MEFKQVFQLLKRWYWLLVLGLVLGAAAGIVYSHVQTPVYESSAKIVVMRAPNQSTAALAYLSPTELATTFSNLIKTQPVLDQLSNQLGFKVKKSQIQIVPVPDSQIVQVVVDADDPQRSEQIANGLVDVSIKQYVDLQVGLYKTSEKNIQAQIQDVQTKISGLQAQIAQTSDKILSDQTQQIQAQMQPLQDEVTQLQKDISQLSPDEHHYSGSESPIGRKASPACPDPKPFGGLSAGLFESGRLKETNRYRQFRRRKSGPHAKKPGNVSAE